MAVAGRVGQCVLPDGRTLEFWDGGDPSGRPVVMHPGTPATHALGRWGHQAAQLAGVRLIALNRPGYGLSTPSAVPSLRAVGDDTAILTRALDLGGYGVLGISGGGPFALATSVVDTEAVRALAVVGGIGPWRELDEPGELDLVDRESLALLDNGDIRAAHAAVMRQAEREFSGLRTLHDEERVDAILIEPGQPISALARDPEYRSLWAENLAVVLDNLEGYVLDNLAWGGNWVASRAEVMVPTIVFDTDRPGAHGRWYADGIENAELITYSGEFHLDVCDSHWPEVLTGLLNIWP